MPQKSPKCIQCDKTENVQHHLADGTNLCGECYEKLKYDIKIEQPEVEPAATSSATSSAIIDEKKTRKSTRSTRFKPSSRANSTAVTANKSVLKGKGRRIKKPPTKTPTSTATIRTVDSLFYDKSYYQVGDIVSLIDRSEDIYYAQIRGLLVDSYCEKAAFLTWLLPTKSSPPVDRFDPSTYLIGEYIGF
jgi:GATA zinc finger domain-containing protein 1